MPPWLMSDLRALELMSRLRGKALGGPGWARSGCCLARPAQDKARRGPRGNTLLVSRETEVREHQAVQRVHGAELAVQGDAKGLDAGVAALQGGVASGGCRGAGERAAGRTVANAFDRRRAAVPSFRAGGGEPLRTVNNGCTVM